MLDSRCNSIGPGKGPLLTALLLAAGLLAACGGDDAATPATPTVPASPAATAGARSPAPAGTGAGAPDCPGDTGVPADAAGGDGLEGRIVFVRLVIGCSPEVYIMNADGSGAANLSNNPALDDEPDLSPDGGKVVFFSGRDGAAYIYVMNADGSGLQQLTSKPGGDASPRWSPDGSRIAFSRNGSLAVMKADGSDLKIIMEPQSSGTAEPCRAGSFVGGWSPDGQRITYYSAVVSSGGAPGRFFVCAIDADGSNLEVLVSQPAGSIHAEPVWSPDGKKVAFRDDRDNKDCVSPSYNDCSFEIYVLDLESGQETNVTNHPALDIEPNWSPDGKWIIFSSNRDDSTNFDLYAMRSDGSDVRRLLNDPGAKDSYPGWVR